MFNKRGQVTLFVILAIVIVALGVLTYFLYPKLVSSRFDVQNPEKFIQSCVEEDLETIITTLSSQGGRLEPRNYYLYQDDKLEYLCYTDQYDELCTVQVPFLRKSIEQEITNSILEKTNECFDSLEESYEQKGYSFSMNRGTIKTELLPKRTILRLLDYRITVSKDLEEEYKSFNIILNNNLYELVSIATNIIEWETTLGEADVMIYMLAYNDLRLHKLKQDEDTKLYIIENKNTGEKFQFASRSLAFPPGYFNE